MPATILVVADQRHRYGRDALAGIDEAARLERWRVVLAEGRAVPAIRRPDGVIGFFGDSPSSVPLARGQAFGVPLVDLGRDAAIDEPAVGGCAAAHLRERGLEHGAWVGFSAVCPFGGPRCAGFAAAMSGRCAGYDLPFIEPAGQVAALAAWLRDRPRPLGVFAINDFIGRIVLDACDAAGLDVPGQVAVLGVDNDLRMCLGGPCPLSSVCMPHQAQGAAGAARLIRLLAGQDPGPVGLVRPGAVCARVSTDIFHCADAAVSKALGWIRRNYAGPSTIDAVAAAAGLNRRTLERRFRALLGRSVHDELQRMRISRAQELLARDGGLPVVAVAAAVGLSPSAFAAAFHAETGSSPGLWRAGQVG